MKVLLITDLTTEKAAAALSVRVGKSFIIIYQCICSGYNVDAISLSECTCTNSST